MEKLITPFGKIDIMIDGQPVPYTAREGKKIKSYVLMFWGDFKLLFIIFLTVRNIA